jgi:N-acetylmuramoyl-L-alanine amidase
MIPQRPRTRRPSRRRLAAPYLIALLGLLVVGACVGAVRLVGGQARVAAVPKLGQSQGPVTIPAGWVPGGMSSGTCVAYRPGIASAGTVFIDPGHGGLDPGAVGLDSAGRQVSEKDLTLAVALDLAHRLLSADFTVVLSRTVDSSVAVMSGNDQSGGVLTAAAVRRDTLARVACADAAKANALVSIHFDAFDDPSVGGIETVYDDARSFTAANASLAAELHSGVLAHFRSGGWEVPDRGVWKDSDAGVTALTNEGNDYGHLLELGPAQAGWVDRPSTMPGALIEPLFLTRPAEADLAASRAGQDAIALGLEDGLKAFMR